MIIALRHIEDNIVLAQLDLLYTLHEIGGEFLDGIKFSTLYLISKNRNYDRFCPIVISAQSPARVTSRKLGRDIFLSGSPLLT